MYFITKLYIESGLTEPSVYLYHVLFNNYSPQVCSAQVCERCGLSADGGDWPLAAAGAAEGAAAAHGGSCGVRGGSAPHPWLLHSRCQSNAPSYRPWCWRKTRASTPSLWDLPGRENNTVRTRTESYLVATPPEPVRPAISASE